MRVRPSIASPSSARILIFIEPFAMIEPFSRGLTHGTWFAMFLLAWLLPTAPSSAKSPTLSDPISIDKAIEHYIRTHPEVIEQSLQVPEAKRQRSNAALASKIQGKHQTFHEALLASRGDLTKDTILAVAGEVGLDAKKLDADMQLPVLQSIIGRNGTLAKDLGISGTPLHRRNGTRAGSVGSEGVKDLIARAGIGK